MPHQPSLKVVLPVPHDVLCQGYSIVCFSPAKHDILEDVDECVRVVICVVSPRGDVATAEQHSLLLDLEESIHPLFVGLMGQALQGVDSCLQLVRLPGVQDLQNALNNHKRL